MPVIDTMVAAVASAGQFASAARHAIAGQPPHSGPLIGNSDRNTAFTECPFSVAAVSAANSGDLTCEF
jgi:hypothetical protein